jgi:hypothetical protein
MKLALLMGLVLLAGQAQANTSVLTTPQVKDLEGTWSVDLSSEPSQPYTQPMNLSLKTDGTIEGDFYNSDIEAGRWKYDRGRLCMSFRTSDGIGPYHTAACLIGKEVHGQTWAEHRNFLFNWNATKASQ